MSQTAASSENETLKNEGEEFNCGHCNLSLVGQRYILQEERPYCLACYDTSFSNVCEVCKEKISCDAKEDLEERT
ncbi:unnamed protein product [Protopolystoma xenopodis]|uniref:FHL1/2/3/5 N-terminal LIM domain-containing protein n=1 Tax=Protopolystoma xenopodis TaxID=117903 RepID=A0A3S5CU20_9PLAT|nr:unnamed protein product [Protopolystoma xenopodis]